ncbi:hypothetical protein DERP_002110 [Dermatophagoides pteronyssinus]|uniref:Uncharacterized protein n=1 Tax=Dermatophagoides pteronyssinus TaxID=6956 RepID=A0ABQ8JGT3_DERPT|nr:hypothetical protein DERP_002110 [Dermatophagoides pteronyssinus]
MKPYFKNIERKTNLLSCTGNAIKYEIEFHNNSRCFPVSDLLANITIPNTKKNTNRNSSLALARNVCTSIFKPRECLVNLNNLNIRIMEKKSNISALANCTDAANDCNIKSE